MERNRLEIRFKKLDPKAVKPNYAHFQDACVDLYSTKRFTTRDRNGMMFTYHTGLAIEIPDGHVGFIIPRSSISTNTGLMLANSVGVIDAGYTGEILVKMKDMSPAGTGNLYEVGDKIAQLIILPFPKLEFEEVDELESSERGSNGFGSTDNNNVKD